MEEYEEVPYEAGASIEEQNAELAQALTTVFAYVDIKRIENDKTESVWKLFVN